MWWMVAASVGQSLLGLGVAWMFGQVIDRAVALDGRGFWRVVMLLAMVIVVQIALASYLRWH
ncbi:hypothetical protein AAGY04_13970, partial [Staphylococcus aureus]